MMQFFRKGIVPTQMIQYLRTQISSVEVCMAALGRLLNRSFGSRVR